MSRLSRALGASALGLSSIVAAGDAHAAGYALDVLSARGTGMGSAVTAFIDDSSAIFYNPAGIARGRGLDAQAGTTLIAPSFKYTNPRGDVTSSNFDIIPPLHAYASGGVTDQLSLGIGVFTPFGLTLGWPDGWEGRRQITRASLATFDINPTAAYRLGPVRIGAGLQVMRATVHLQRQIAFGQAEGATDLGGATWGFGGNVGVQVDAIPKVLSFGAHYRSAVKLAFDGLADFQNVPAPLANAIHDQAVSTSLVTPDTLAIGAAVRPTERIVIDAEAVWFGWANFRSIDLTFPDDTSNTLASSKPKSWENSLNYHVGVEGILSDRFRVRGGALYDPSPSPSDTLTPDLPDADRINLAVGGSYRHSSGFYADLGYQLLLLLERESASPELPGTYGGFANILGLSVGYRTPERGLAPPPPVSPRVGSRH